MNSTLSAPLTGVSPADIRPVSPPPHEGRRAGVLEDPSFLPGVAVGLVAASIGALYTVFARWGVAHGLAAQDMTVLRFGVAGRTAARTHQNVAGAGLHNGLSGFGRRTAFLFEPDNMKTGSTAQRSGDRTSGFAK